MDARVPNNAFNIINVNYMVYWFTFSRIIYGKDQMCRAYNNFTDVSPITRPNNPWRRDRFRHEGMYVVCVHTI